MVILVPPQGQGFRVGTAVIQDGAVTNVKVNAAAAIAGSKLATELGSHGIDISTILGIPGTIGTIGTGSLAGTTTGLIVAAESGTADILDNLTGYSADDIVAIYADAGDTITVTHEATGAGEFHLAVGNDITLSENIPLLVRKDADGDWYEISGPVEYAVITLAVGNPADSLVVADEQVDFPIPQNRPFVVKKVKASVSTDSTSGTPTFAIRDDGTDILSTDITIDENESDSTTAATPPVIDSTKEELSVNASISIDVDVAGTDTAGGVVTLEGYTKKVGF